MTDRDRAFVRGDRQVSWEEFRRDPQRFVREAGTERIVVLNSRGKPAMSLCCPDPDEEPSAGHPLHSTTSGD